MPDPSPAFDIWFWLVLAGLAIIGAAFYVHDRIKDDD